MLVTAESVTAGHPDKLCDQISDAILDAMLDADPDSRVACETAITLGTVFILGEVTCKGYVEIPALVRSVICDVGYNYADLGFDGNTCGVMTSIQRQSPNIARGVNHPVEKVAGSVDKFDELGAGDQGIVVGYACNETPNYMPLAAQLANELSMELTSIRRCGMMPSLRPDGKTQVTLRYTDGHPFAESIVIAAQHEDYGVDPDVFAAQINSFVVGPVLAKYGLLCKKLVVNGTGAFTIGGPASDTGFTGRKIIVDGYGPVCAHGGGAFSGKDPTKVDRSGAYMARHVARSLVAAHYCEEAEVRVAYVIGAAHPLSIQVIEQGVFSPVLTKVVEDTFDFRPAAIIERFGLVSRIGWRYQQTSVGGHFGREFPWESITQL